MGTKGASLTSEATFEVAGYKYADEVIRGDTNSSILGAYTQTVAGGMGIGVAGVWTDVAAGLKTEMFLAHLEVNYGKRSYGFGPQGHLTYGTQYEYHSGHWKSSDSYAGLSAPDIVLAATTSATVRGPIINATGAVSVSLLGSQSLLELNARGANLTNGRGAVVDMDNDGILVAHPTLTTISAGAVANIAIEPTSIQLNAATTNINGALINLGQPAVTNANISEQLAQAEAAAAAAAAEEAEEEAAETNWLAVLQNLVFGI